MWDWDHLNSCLHRDLKHFVFKYSHHYHILFGRWNGFCLFRSTFFRRNPWFKLFFHFWGAVMHPCFINCNKIRLNFEIVTRDHFWFTISYRGTHLADNFFMPQCSCNILNTRYFEMFTLSDISRTFTQRSSKTISWILLTIPSVVISTGTSSASVVLLKPQQNSECIIHKWFFFMNYIMWRSTIAIIFFQIFFSFGFFSSKK